MRPIDADALLKGKDDHEMISTHLIFNAPTLDVKPVIKGKWIEKEYGYGDTCYDCSVCGESFWAYDREIFMKDTNFCPNCGADMRESEDKE